MIHNICILNIVHNFLKYDKYVIFIACIQIKIIGIKIVNIKNYKLLSSQNYCSFIDQIFQ